MYKIGGHSSPNFYMQENVKVMFMYNCMHVMCRFNIVYCNMRSHEVKIFFLCKGAQS